MSGVGGITESDVTLAAASGAVVIGFNVRANKQARDAAERDGIEIRYYNIIYDLVDDVKAAMSGLLAPNARNLHRQRRRSSRCSTSPRSARSPAAASPKARSERGAKVRLIRDNVVIHEGTLSTLKRFKDEVKEVPGQECGMAFENYQDMRAGDVIECFGVLRRLLNRTPPNARSSTTRPTKRRSSRTDGHSIRAPGVLFRKSLQALRVTSPPFPLFWRWTFWASTWWFSAIFSSTHRCHATASRKPVGSTNTACSTHWRTPGQPLIQAFSAVGAKKASTASSR
jgi:hypothetical protein